MLVLVLALVVLEGTPVARGARGRVSTGREEELGADDQLRLKPKHEWKRRHRKSSGTKWNDDVIAVS